MPSFLKESFIPPQQNMGTNFHVSFNVNCEELGLDIDDLLLELNSQIGELQFAVEEKDGLRDVLICIGFNDRREAAEINSFVCDLLYNGDIEAYTGDVDELYFGNVEALGVTVPRKLDEAAFGSYKDAKKLSQEERINNVKNVTADIAGKGTAEVMEKFIIDKLHNDGKLLRKKLMYPDCVLPYEMYAEWLHYGMDKYKSTKKPVEVKYFKGMFRVLIFIATLEPTYFPLITIKFKSNNLFDYIDELEKSINEEFQTNIRVELRYFAGEKEDTMLRDGMTIKLSKSVNVDKFIKFMNRFMLINNGVYNKDDLHPATIQIDAEVFQNGPEPPKECEWATAFNLVAKDIQCSKGRNAFNILSNIQK